MEQLGEGVAIDDGQIKQWFAASYKDATGIEDQDRIVEALLRKEFTVGLRLLSLITVQIPLKDKLRYPAFLEGDLMGELLRQTFESHIVQGQTKALPRIIEEMMIAGFHQRLSAEQRDLTKTYFQSKVSPTWGWLFFGNAANMNGGSENDAFISGVFIEQGLSKSFDELYSIQDEHLKKNVCDIYFAMLDNNKVRRICSYSHFRENITLYQSAWDEEMVLFSLRGLSLSPQRIRRPSTSKNLFVNAKGFFCTHISTFCVSFPRYERFETWQKWIFDSQSQTYRDGVFYCVCFSLQQS